VESPGGAPGDIGPDGLVPVASSRAASHGPRVPGPWLQDFSPHRRIPELVQVSAAGEAGRHRIEADTGLGTPLPAKMSPLSVKGSPGRTHRRSD
jgi:hypothetical protein